MTVATEGLRDSEAPGVFDYTSEWNPDAYLMKGSLLAMLQFYASRFMDIVQTLERVAEAYDRLPAGTVFTQADLAENHLLRESLQEMRSNAEEIGLAHSVKEVDTILWEIDRDCVASRLMELLRSLSRRIRDELDDCMIFMVQRSRAEYYEQDEPLDGSGIVQKLPSVMDDAVEAGNCFALGRYTACVFHLMRVMEACVKALGGKFGLKSAADGTWGLIESNLTDAVKKAYPDKQDTEHQSYMGILAHLGAVRTAWRNTTMHPKSAYTEKEAKTLIGLVSAFTNDVAAVL